MLLHLALASVSCVLVTACVANKDREQTQKFTDAKAANNIQLSSNIPNSKKQNSNSSTEENKQSITTEFLCTKEPEQGNNISRANSPRSSDNCMTLTPTQKTNKLGNPLYELNLYADGKLFKTYEVVTGRSKTQNRDRNKAGTEAPLPDGSYRVASSTIPGTHPEVGGRFLPIQPLFSTGRSALGIHYDPSFEKNNGEDGTSGCIALTNKSDFNEVLEYIRTYQPQDLEVSIQNQFNIYTQGR
jgi:hypothetical protein